MDLNKMGLAGNNVIHNICFGMVRTGRVVRGRWNTIITLTSQLLP